MSEDIVMRPIYRPTLVQVVEGVKVGKSADSKADSGCEKPQERNEKNNMFQTWTGKHWPPRISSALNSGWTLQTMVESVESTLRQWERVQGYIQTGIKDFKLI